MKSNWLQDFGKSFKQMLGRSGRDGLATNHEPAALDLDSLKGMVEDIVTTRSDEIACEECFERLDGFVEMVLAGKNAAEALPLVQDHLNRCGDCHEEFEALLAALRAAG